MRIVGGTLKGRTLAGPATGATRPTSDRVRESIFNILAHGIAGFEMTGVRVLDLFAGTGALGFEALSRGAKFCQFVDDHAAARATIRNNAEALGVTGLCKIWRRDAANLGACAPQSPFGLAFIDPPYHRGLGSKAMASLIDGGWLDANAIAVLEEANDASIELHPRLALIDTRSYGDTCVRFHRVS